MKRNIVYYIDSKEYGGAEQSLYNLIEALDLNHFRPILFHHPSEGISRLVDKVRELEIETVCTPEINGFSDIKNMRIFMKEIKRIRPLVFHAHLPWNLRCKFGIVCAYLSSVPIIIATQHGFKKIASFKSALIQKLISLLLGRYIAVSHGIADNLKESILFKNRLKVIHNGINTDRFTINKSNALITSLKEEKHLPIVLIVARLDKNKGHVDLINAASRTPNTIFLLVGDGPEKSSFEQQAIDLGVDDRVLFPGHRDDIPELLYGCDIFVLPSLFEGLPLTILEAMASGKPVIATEIEGIKEIIIDGENGVLVPRNDPASISESIRFLLSNPSVANKLASTGKKTVLQEFTSEKMAQEVTNTYLDILRENAVIQQSESG